METKEFQGKSTEQAMRLACDYFNLPLDLLQVEVLDSGASGILGLFGARRARIRVRPSGPSNEQAVAEMIRELTGEPAPKPRPAQNSSVGIMNSYSSSEGELPEGQTALPMDGGTRQDEEKPQVVAFAQRVLERLVVALDDEALVRAGVGPMGIQLEIEGENAGMLIGRRGQTLEALQYLCTRIVSHQQGRPVRINLDAGGYRKRRQQNLEDLAMRMADKARHLGRPVSLGPLTSLERRVVHMTLKEEKDISTVSRGRGELKKVLISPRR